jgi:hypothetical protein
VKEMKRIIFTWEICGEEKTSVRRHCHNCGKTADFADSGVRRHNANGKVIHEFAIYKCENGHTWNKSLGLLKPSQSLTKYSTPGLTDEISRDYISTDITGDIGADVIEIRINRLRGKVRLDKELSARITGISRSKIVKMINEGGIQVNEQKVKPGTLLKEGDTVVILSKR